MSEIVNNPHVNRHARTTDSMLYYGMVWRGAVAGLSGYLVVALPPYPPPRWGLITVATAVFAALGVALYLGWRSAKAGELTNVHLAVHNVLANTAVAVAIDAVGTGQGLLLPLLFVIIIYNSAFRTGWLVVLSWVNGTIACLVGLLLSGMPGWPTVTTTLVFAACAAAIQSSVWYLTRRIRQLAHDLDVEREIASLAAHAVDRDMAFATMLPPSATLLGVGTFAVVRVDEAAPRVIAATRGGVIVDASLADLDVDGGALIDLSSGEMFRLCAGRGEVPDPDALSAVRDLFTPVIERSRYLTGLRRQAESDGLTGLANRRHLDDMLATLVAADQRFALILIDLDGFKDHNDAHGHLAGDDVLIHTADTIRSVTRSGDLAARYGGEEFCVVIRDEDLLGAAALERRLREAWRDADLPVTYSAGIAVRVVDEDAQQVVRRADDALYRAKQSGRNITVHAS